MVDLKALEEKWKKKWAESKAFEVAADPEKKKFFGTFPYPYMNGFLHMGHFYSIMRLEVFSRYKRLTGHNTLFAQGWHCTGSPIEAAAKRVRENEPKQIESMKKQGFSDEEIKKFGEPKYWTDFFPEKGKIDLTNMGMAIDFRRSFITTDLNPHYNKFIEWQFRKLKEKGYVVKGKHPVVWDPVENCPVGDHDRIEGEGEVPQEFVLFKNKLEDNVYVVTATLRPDTVLGVTNLYVNPDVPLKKITVKSGENWIVGEPCITELESQGFEPKIFGDVKGRDLIGKKVETISGREVMCLPASFVDANYGTGIVHSCPSDSADDLIALQDLQKNEKVHKEFGLDTAEVQAIEAIPVLVTPGYGDNPAQAFLDKYGVKSQKEKKTLDKIKNELYKESFYNSTFNHLYKDFFSKNLEGTPVQEGKDFVKQEIIAMGKAEIYYQLTGKVVARSLSECVVKVVEDQWFMNYADYDWKKLAHECLDNMKLYPEKSRQQFNYVIDWLQNWACVREVGLGTKLPWDDKWVIESLSDSTIYMVYYTIAHLLQKEDVNEVDDSLFEHIFLDGDKPKRNLKHLDEMKKEFDYWYPMDFRNSGKDLIQNHLTFSIFNHVGIFPKEKWPQSFGVNGWVTVDGNKMSKSLGNFIMLKDLVRDYSIDAARVTIMSGGEGLDDPNWDSEFAKSIQPKIEHFHDFCLEHYDKGVNETSNADKWMESQLNLIIKECTAFMEDTLFRSGLQKSFFELQRVMRNYVSKTDGKYNKDIMNRAIEAAVIMISPAAPFVTEEIWSAIGKEGFVLNADWPSFDESKIDLKAIYLDEVISHMKKDVAAVQKLAKVEKLSKVTLIIADSWKYDLMKVVKDALNETRNPGDIIKKVMDTDLKQYNKDIAKIVPKLVKNPALIPQVVLSKEDEVTALKEAAGALAKEYNAEIDIIEADSTDAKAGQAMPGKPAILVE